jgi:hypothetical protein
MPLSKIKNGQCGLQDPEKLGFARFSKIKV